MFKANKYDKIYSDRSKEVDFLLKHLRGKTVLDIGGGTGAISEALNKKGFKCLCVDPQPEMLKLAKKRGIDVYCSTIEDAYLTQEFDNAVMVFHVFNFLTDPKKAFQNIEESLKGRLIFSYWNSDIKKSGWKFSWKPLRLSRKKWIGDTAEIDFWFPFFHEKHIMKVYSDDYINGLLKNFRILRRYKTKHITIIVAEKCG